VAELLIEYGVPGNRISAAAYADTQPSEPNETKEGRAKNRRIEIALQPNLDELPDLSGFEDED
jgi:chemotaxis protein MotB